MVLDLTSMTFLDCPISSCFSICLVSPALLLVCVLYDTGNDCWIVQPGHEGRRPASRCGAVEEPRPALERQAPYDDGQMWAHSYYEAGP